MENNNKPSFTAILVDDEIWALRGLKGIVNWEEFGINIIGEFTDSSLALEAVRTKRPDLLFTDIRMPGLDGMSLIETLKAEKIDTRIVIVTAYKDFEIARQALKNEVSDYLIKPLDKEEVKNALTKLCETLSIRTSSEFSIFDYNLFEKDIISNPSVARFVSSAIKNSSAVIFVSDEELPAGEGITEIFIDGFYHSYIVISEKSESLRGTLSGAYGVSCPFKSKDELYEAIRQAEMSYEGAFIFSSNDQTAKIEEFLFENMDKKLSMDDVSNEFYLSKPYLFELFRNNTDTSVMNFLKGVRLSKAALLLHRKGASVRSVAEAVGFDDFSYFGKIFKEKYGITPEQFIK